MKRKKIIIERKKGLFLKIIPNFNLTFALGKAIRLQLRKTSNSFPLGFQVSSSDTSGGSRIDLKIKTIGKHFN